MNSKQIRTLTQGALIAALYVVLCELFAPISFRDVQFRVAEGLTILPFFTPAAIPGLFIGCLLGNLLAGAIPLDVIFGSIATLLGALGTYAIGRAIRRSSAQKQTAMKFLLPIPPIAANTVIVPLILYYGYSIRIPIYIQMLTVGLGEIAGCGVFGMIILFAIEKIGVRSLQTSSY